MLIDDVRYTALPDGTVHATCAGKVHELVWTPDPHVDGVPDTGNVTLDGQGRPMGLHLGEHPFHVQAEAFFQVRHVVPASLTAWQRRSAQSTVASALESAATAAELGGA